MTRIPKYKIPVRISLAQEEQVLGVIFLRQEQRILDMLCDPHQFFPVSTKTGMFLVNKASVSKVEVLDRDYIVEHKENFPSIDEKLGSEDHAELAQRRTGQMQSA